MSETRKKLAALSQGKTGNATERILLRQQNKGWLKKSQAIAIKVLSTLRAKSMSQVQLAELMNVSPQQISKIVKGSENLTLDTIAALEKALGIVFMDIPKSENIFCV